jgi:hypothetical protein
MLDMSRKQPKPERAPGMFLGSINAKLYQQWYANRNSRMLGWCVPASDDLEEGTSSPRPHYLDQL